ncbi:UBX domain-containing protein 7 [Candida viswanathii]|uniref:UBX domain-containing protein 2 n=1 Tax=Candida viswanathii TaxID=5486 RepID=A0A367Y4S5_9ASCO|nr:UBX domain-containing protein 7 [Candida viswanathii]
MSSHIDHLFSSSVQQAVASTVQLQKPLFVYLTQATTDESGDEFLSRFIDEEITEVLDKNFVLLKLIESTPDFGYFKQLFKVVKLPSFYIVNLGKVEGVVSSETDKNDFLALVQRLASQRTVASSTPTQSNTPVQDNTPVATSTHTQTSTPGQSTPASSPPPPTTRTATSTSETNRRTSMSEHDITAKKYKEQVEKARREKLEEKKRLRALLEADRREQELRRKEEVAAARQGSLATGTDTSTIPKSSSSASICFLSIKLFDGSTIKHEFKAEDTLSDVRKWLDSEIEIIQPASSMPSFATSAYLHPTGYVFHRPVLPRVTYLEEQESNTLKDLELTPRSALILKPTYDETDPHSPNASGERAGFFGSIVSGVGKVGSALFAFFDYGVNSPYHQHQQHQHQQQQQQQQQQNQQQNQDHPGLDSPLHNSNENLEDLQTLLSDPLPFNLGHPGAVGAPGVLTFDNRSASSLLMNIESHNDDEIHSNISRPHTPSHASSESHIVQRPLRPELGSRSSTPRPQSSRRVQTIYDEVPESSSSNKDKKHIDTYNGNSLSLNDRDDENKKQD